ncbi:MAG TPA: ABC transporter substrate-binding protein [Ktedonobacteraceae bacterium]|nr:ABC transporter substrate-binding protein [Ktedonobacteraceae bacterium]
MIKRHRLLTILMVVLVSLVSACNIGATGHSSGSAPATFTIAYQPGLGVASLVVLKYQKTLEKQFPNTRFQWKILFSGASVREAVIANQAQLGSLGISPFLIGWDRGVNWKVLVASSRADIWLVSNNPRIKSLKDFTSNDKIGIVAPDAQQALLLRKAAQQQLGNAHALDKNIVAITSSDGEQALLSGQIAAHYAGSPFQEREVAAGGHIVLHSTDAFGPVGTGVLALTQSFYNQYPDFSKKFYQDYVAASAFAKKNLDQTAQYLAEDQGGGGTVAQFKTLLAHPDFVIETTPSGLLAYARFMQSIGLISKVPGSVKDFELPPLNGSGN